MGKEFKKVIAFAAVCMLTLTCAGCGRNTSGTDNENVSDTVDRPANEDSNTGNQGDATDRGGDETAENISGTNGEY